MSLFREDATSAVADFHAVPLSVKLEFGDASFCKEGKQENLELKLNLGCIGGRQVFLPNY